MTMLSTKNLVILIAGALFSPASPLRRGIPKSRAQPPPQPRFHRIVRASVARDNKVNPVRDLNRETLPSLQDGKKQQISTFDFEMWINCR